MSCGSLQTPFNIELYAKTRGYNNSGQPIDNWNLVKTMECDFMPSRAEERLVGRLQNPTSYNIWLHPDEPIDNTMQLKNLKDSTGSLIEKGPFNVVGIRKNRGWSKLSHLTINAQVVLE